MEFSRYASLGIIDVFVFNSHFPIIVIFDITESELLFMKENNLLISLL